jgi:hypothetical protein
MRLSVRGRPSMWLLLLGVFVLSGCTAAKLQPAQLSSMRNIGIVSLLPTSLRYTKIGVTVFNNEFESQLVGEALNDAARTSAEKSLQRLPNTGVFQLRNGISALSARYYANSLVMSDSSERIQEELGQLARVNGLDAIVVIGEVFDSDQGRGGVRIYLRTGIGNVRFASVLPDVVVHVVDKNGKVLARDYVQAIGVRAKRADDRSWEYSLEANLDASTRAKLLADMEQAISSNVAGKFVRLGF